MKMRVSDMYRIYHPARGKYATKKYSAEGLWAAEGHVWRTKQQLLAYLRRLGKDKVEELFGVCFILEYSDLGATCWIPVKSYLTEGQESPVKEVRRIENIVQNLYNDYWGLHDGTWVPDKHSIQASISAVEELFDLLGKVGACSLDCCLVSPDQDESGE